MICCACMNMSFCLVYFCFRIAQNLQQVDLKEASRLNPVFVEVDIAGTGEQQNITFGTKLEFENTRHRYPWICSLRSKTENKQHYCAATLLRLYWKYMNVYVMLIILNDPKNIFFL